MSVLFARTRKNSPSHSYVSLFLQSVRTLRSTNGGKENIGMATVYLFLHRPYHYQMLRTRQARLVQWERGVMRTPPIVIKIKVIVWSKTMTEARRRRVWTVDNSKINPPFPFPNLLLFQTFQYLGNGIGPTQRMRKRKTLSSSTAPPHYSLNPVIIHVLIYYEQDTKKCHNNFKLICEFTRDPP